MSTPKSERLLNLVILLLGSRTHVTKEQIRELIEAYQGGTAEAFDKMFERDKEDLRALGIPIEVGAVDRFFEDEQGYRIRPDAFALPDIELTPDEGAVIGLAARVWQHAGLASATSDALVKLKAAGLELDREALDTVQSRLVIDEPAFDGLWNATVARQAVSFDYRRPGQREVTRRHLEPWGVVSVNNRWYVAGFDRDRQAPRSFRLSRIRSEVVTDGPPGAYRVPPGTDVRRLTASLIPEERPVEAVVLARTGAAQGLRRWAESVEADVTGPDTRSGWDRLRLQTPQLRELALDLLGHGDSVYVESPPELREHLVRALRALVGTEGAA